MKNETKIRFFKEDALIDDDAVEKEDVLDFINYERSSSKKRLSKKIIKSNSDKYIFTLDDSIISIKFPHKYKDSNQHYQEIIEKLYQSDKKILIKRLKLLSLALSLGIVGGIAISKPLKNSLKKSIDCFEIMALDEELKYHTNGILLDGEIYPVSEEDHMKNGCDFGEVINSLEDEIREYCKEKGLGEEVADAAILKYEYLNSGKSNEAEDINLHKVYIKNKKN